MPGVLRLLVLLPELRKHPLAHPTHAGAEAHVHLLEVERGAYMQERVDAILQRRERAVCHWVEA
jgi:hypothetical protein